MAHPAGSRPPKAFKTAEAFRRWLERYHAKEKELIVRLFKVSAHHRGIGYAQALDEALCFGWIDGVRRSHDADSFTTRFTPRKARSKWSNVNLRHFDRLKAAGKVHPAGHTAFDAYEPERHKQYSFEAPEAGLSSAFEKRFRANKKAWAFFQSQAPWYRRVCAFYVMSAKKEETRERRLLQVINDSARGKRIGPLAGTKK